MTEPLPDPDEFRRLGHGLVDALADHLGELAERPDAEPVLAANTPREQLARWSDDFAGGADPAALWRAAIEQAHHLHHRRSVGHQMPPPTALGMLSDLVTSALNNSAAIFEMGPVATATERRVVRWMCDKLGYPTSSAGLLTSGGSLGNLTALLAMRQAQAGYDAWREGSRDGERFAVLAGAQTHYCVERAVRVLGWGDGGAVQVPIDPIRYRMDAALLPRALDAATRAGRRVLGVVASACSTSTGSIDDLDRVADFCRDHDLWFHVDGAHGASFAISPRERHKLRGIERADSVVWDAHKTLLCPALVTGVLFRDGRHADASFAPKAEYLFASDDADVADLDLGRRTLECTKPALGLKLYVTLASLGEATLARYLEQVVDIVAAFADDLERATDFELAHRPDANIVCFRYRPRAANDLDAVQERVRAAVVHSGGFFLTRTTLGDGVFLRCTVLNPETTGDDLRGLLDAIRSAGPTVDSAPVR